MTKRILPAALFLAALVPATGCVLPFGERAKYGVTFYCPGVANVDMGDAGLRDGLQQRGYRGEVCRLTWSYTFNPAIDQTVRGIARLGALRLAGYIQDYVDKYPGREVNVVGLSAGTGVAIWALESLHQGYAVNNVVLLGSSLSADYDVNKALEHVKGRIYCYYSDHDAVLAGPMKVFGTIDGKLLVDGAGAVGLTSAVGNPRVVNIAWKPEYESLGYSGGHLDSTSPAFVREHVAEHLISPATVARRGTAAATPPATGPQAARPDSLRRAGTPAPPPPRPSRVTAAEPSSAAAESRAAPAR